MTTRFEIAALAFAILGLVAILAVLVVWWGRGEAGDGGSGAAKGPRSDSGKESEVSLDGAASDAMAGDSARKGSAL
jgi:hypothetical protein